MNVHHNFFELGANSILLSIIYKDLNEVFPGVLQVTDLFSYPTISLLAEHISNHMASPIHSPCPELEAEAAPRINQDTITAAPISVKLHVMTRIHPILLHRSLTLSRWRPVPWSRMMTVSPFIGVGLDLPAGNDLRSYWEVLIHGINVVKDIPLERSVDITKHLRARNLVKSKLSLENADILMKYKIRSCFFRNLSARCGLA